MVQKAEGKKRKETAARKFSVFVFVLRNVVGYAHMQDEASHNRKIVLHVMSNNGFFFLAACLLHAVQLRTVFSAVVMDSCPCSESWCTCAHDGRAGCMSVENMWL
jgi:hypothetical protein